MTVEFTAESQALTVVLTGEIDHHSARSMRNEIDQQIDTHHPAVLILDFAGVSFMDSSGIGLIMGRHRLMEMLDGEVVIQNPPAHIQRVLRLSGMERIAHIRTERSMEV